ncbi:hypothetical protein [Zavarzinella formosa]|uniref:hypothetical protein n=1 Tax=Zavarzinella formosa TaxID=360055 RepID=UPI0002E1623D|nr:hypothetical protein [Zavarzinella formosa]
MAATIHELHDSRNLSIGRDSASAPWRFLVTGAADEEEAWALANAAAPATYSPAGTGTLLKDKIDTDNQGAGNYYVTVNYSSGKADDNASAGSSPTQTTNPDGTSVEGEGNVAPGTDPNQELTMGFGRDMSFSTGGGTQHITQAFSTEYSVTADQKRLDQAADDAQATFDAANAAWAAAVFAAAADPENSELAEAVTVALAAKDAAETAYESAEGAALAEANKVPDYGNAINVGPNGVEGVEIHAPDPKFQVSFKVPSLTVGRFTKLCFHSCKMNAVAWQGFFPREILFLGTDGSYTDADKKWSLTYQFAYSPTLKNLPINDQITVPLKRGWDYLWVLYEHKDDKVADSLVMRPKCVYVMRVYSEFDFLETLGF